jgi:hypothetical protein
MLVAMVLVSHLVPQLNDSESNRQLPFSPVGFGVGAFVILLVLLAVTYAFRSVGKRH